MRWNGIYVNACAAVLGRGERTEDAVAEGRYDADEAAADGFLSISVADDGPAVELAVRAGGLVMDRATAAPDDIRLVVHSSCNHQGLDHFAPASYVQGRTVGGSAAAVEVKQYSNGGLAAVEIAAAYLANLPEPAAALLTTSDVFALPGFDRYRSDKGVVFGDGGTGLVLSRAGGVARLLSTAVISDGTYGAVYLGNSPFAQESSADEPVDLRARRDDYLAENGELLLEIVQSLTERQRESVTAALADAGLDAADIDRWVLTNVGRTLDDVPFRETFGITDEKTTWEWGRRVGHIGAADQIAGLTHLMETGEAEPGDRIALCGIGMGFTYACAVVEITERPHWSPGPS
ncbi:MULTISPECIES: ketoacyl-ACP synthase III family protein [Streptomyces]|uniref:Ketoacyl-ACP synthase III family protein n=1 Tax=Streptomyces doudnae TaxID=3075536 RepID=A0ABD5EPT8_9ACTN|nr:MULTISPECIES: ketoacyl-ACP synthase III family protein [unclassified Streptomyces]MDT0436335.1 ketoacyl-ACP synthase III family protein [Streptomyces sp. DSM 41981]MYQ65289.1 3-oxoacyl-ACP synthase [Streptomyces sp. SID4950]SCD96406.1 3-oxoacyl-[acyl-carrier-protein] synthase-3 [Streptomyces sp. SolWspMP-5a-2]